MRNVITILILLTLSSCTHKKLVIVHKPLVIENPCPYTPLNKQQKDYLRKETGHTIAYLILKNKLDCESRAITNQKIIDAHNKAHSKK